eukprot:529518-Prorocentrum_lima.AAC.1
MCAGQRQHTPQQGIATVGLHSQQRCGNKRITGWKFLCSVGWKVLEKEGQDDSDPKDPFTV